MEGGEKSCLKFKTGKAAVPGMRAMVPRFSRTRYTGLDQYGDPIDRTVEGIYSCVVQHECDHLLGTHLPDAGAEFQPVWTCGPGLS
jgi:peptide deformylase